MGILLDRLSEKRLLVSDGAWGTMLQARGLEPGQCPELWNVTHPDAVRAVALAYVQAGSDLILTNTFGGSSLKLAKSGFGDRVGQFNELGARLSLEAAGDAIVAASVGPTGQFLEPYGDATPSQLEAVFSEQIDALLRGGVHAICIETMTSVEEAQCAIRAAKALDAHVDVIATMTFDQVPDGFRTIMGVDPQQAAEGLTQAGADIIGSNCGNGIDQMVAVAAELRGASDKPILIHANAGVPEYVDGQTVFRQSPDDMAAKVEAVVGAGATIIGGCCGTTPDHIAAVKTVVDRLLNRP